MIAAFLSLIGITVLTIAILILFIWAVALVTDDASVIDLVWGLSFALISIACGFWLNAKGLMTGYAWLLVALPCIWAARYTAYIFWRNIGHGEDPRYTAMREGKTKKQWPVHLLFPIYTFQAAAMFVVSLPITLGLASGVTFKTPISTLAIIGATICITGIAYEAIADYQLAKFKHRKKTLGAEVTGKVLDTGLWRLSRHPNYFGNALLWWGIFLVAGASPWGFLSIAGPLFMTFAIIRISGADHLERTLSKRPEYKEYMTRTPKFVPGFKKLSPQS